MNILKKVYVSPNMKMNKYVLNDTITTSGTEPEVPKVNVDLTGEAGGISDSVRDTVYNAFFNQV